MDAGLLRTLLLYDPLSGLIYWRERHAPNISPLVESSWNTRFAGKLAFTSINQDGYFVGKINNITLLSHRVIWAMMTGNNPSCQIDHINGVRSDNRFHNLRDVSHYDNHRNLRRSSNNKSGITGVYWSERTQKWVAQIQVNGKQKNLGYFLSKDDAISCRRDAEKRNGFHVNHGN